MIMSRHINHSASALAGCMALGMLVASTGCQVDDGGQTLPSPYYLQDDVQYFPAGPEFKLSREAAALEAAQEAEAARRPRRTRAGQRLQPVEPAAPLEEPMPLPGDEEAPVGE